MAEGVFGDGYSAAYDTLYEEKDYRAEVDLIEAALRRHGSGREKKLLDLGCGTASHAALLAGDGYDVTGVDLSPAMLERAKAKIADLPPAVAARIALKQGDVGTVEAGGPFDAAIMMFAVLGYQTSNEALLRAARNARRHLAPGGLFVADFWYGPAVLTQRPGDRVRIITREGGELIRATHSDIDTGTGIVTVNFRVWTLSGDRLVGRTDESHQMRYFFDREIDLVMGAAGFNVVSLSAFPSLDAPLSDQTWNALLVAKAA